jgi:hypothetical protein
MLLEKPYCAVKGKSMGFGFSQIAIIFLQPIYTPIRVESTVSNRSSKS